MIKYVLYAGCENIKVFEAFMEDLQDTAVERDMDEREGWNKNYLNAAMMELLRVDCEGTAEDIKNNLVRRWTEGHKMFTGWAAESSMTMAYGSVIYSSTLTNLKKDTKFKRPSETEVAKRNFEEAKTGKGGVELEEIRILTLNYKKYLI